VPVSLGVAVSAAMAFAVNPGKKTILKAKITKVTTAVFQLLNSFIALAPFHNYTLKCFVQTVLTPADFSGIVSDAFFNENIICFASRKSTPILFNKLYRVHP
jgi:hypothetical protein